MSEIVELFDINGRRIPLNLKTVILIFGLLMLNQKANTQIVIVDTVIQSQEFGFLQDGVGINKTIYGHFDDSLSGRIIFLNMNPKKLLYVVDDRHTYIFFKDTPFLIKEKYLESLSFAEDTLIKNHEVYISYLTNLCNSGVAVEEENFLCISSGYITLRIFKSFQKEQVIIVFHDVSFSKRE
ncbi:hypothetical protein IPN41_01500 [Candidatus Falkowbacteria bacterium]|nr:MAG: hypothetical protein IPN41_01500 [Candidatus Falkowbacteria bacterium]